MIEEGYFKSFPTETVIKDLIRALGKTGLSNGVDFDIITEDQLGQADLYNDLEIIRLIVVASATEGVDFSIKPVLARDGWYLSTVVKEPNVFTFICEPKFPISNDRVFEVSRKLISKYETFYHCTFRKYARKIKTNGLVPSFGGRSEFAHPERIYLFTDMEVAFEFGGVSLDGETECILKRKVRQHDAIQKYQDHHDMDVVVFEVDLKRLIDDGCKISLYHDNRWDATSPVFFTVNSIKPAYLTEIDR